MRSLEAHGYRGGCEEGGTAPQRCRYACRTQAVRRGSCGGPGCSVRLCLYPHPCCLRSDNAYGCAPRDCVPHCAHPTSSRACSMPCTTVCGGASLTLPRKYSYNILVTDTYQTAQHPDLPPETFQSVYVISWLASRASSLFLRANLGTPCPAYPFFCRASAANWPGMDGEIYLLHLAFVGVLHIVQVVHASVLCL